MKKINGWLNTFNVVFSLGLLLPQLLWASEANISADPMAKEVLTYINQYRAERGLSPLKMNAAITREATRHSQEMANHQVPFGHTGFQQRMKHLYHDLQYATGGAENVAYNYKTAKIVVDGWIKSPGHRQNIVGRYDLTGVGIVRDAAGKLYYTQLFVRQKDPVHTAQFSRSSHPPAHHRHTRFFIG
jgi:uncharacterized protein YkwD